MADYCKVSFLVFFFVFLSCFHREQHSWQEHAVTLLTLLHTFTPGWWPLSTTTVWSVWSATEQLNWRSCRTLKGNIWGSKRRKVSFPNFFPPKQIRQICTDPETQAILLNCSLCLINKTKHIQFIIIYDLKKQWILFWEGGNQQILLRETINRATK